MRNILLYRLILADDDRKEICRSILWLHQLFLHNVRFIKNKMTKKAAKKPNKLPPKRTTEKKKKLPRGYKECGSCKQLLHIHKYVCDGCGFKHDMKKKKVDILKNLNKVTPKLLRSLIELNDFNDLSHIRAPLLPFSDLIPKHQLSAPSEYRKRKSSKSQSSSSNLGSAVWSLGRSGFYSKMNANLVSLCAVLDGGMLICESIEKTSKMSESEKVTIRAYKLQKFHRVGETYTGRSCLHYLQNLKLSYKINVGDHVMSLKAIRNRVGLLTGRGTILCFDLETTSRDKEDRNINVHNSLEIKPHPEDSITVFEWLNTYSQDTTTYLVAGTLMGHLSLFKLEKDRAELVRFISNAHFEAITCIAECPLGNEGESLFASGSYDGTVAVFSVNRKEPLYRLETSNRKINSLLWDPGAKFIFVMRDQNQDSGVLACFFAILKNDQSVALSDQIDFRLVKNTCNCKVLHESTSTSFALLDTYQCLLRVLEIEELRKNSLKRKKAKKEEEETVLKLVFEGNFMKVVESDLEEESKNEVKLNQHFLTLPRIADACQVQVAGKEWLYGITYDGFVFQLSLP